MIKCILSFVFGSIFGAGMMCIMHVSSAESRREEKEDEYGKGQDKGLDY